MVRDGNALASEHARQLAHHGRGVQAHEDQLATQEAEISALKSDKESLISHVQVQDTKIETLEAQNGEQSVKIQRQDAKIRGLEKKFELLMAKLAQGEFQTIPLAG